MGHGGGGGLKAFFSGITDLFSKHVFLNIKGHHDVPTAIGTILTIILVSVVVSQGLYSTYKMVNHLQPQILQLNDYKSDPPVVHLNRTNNFNFGLTLTVNGKNYNMSEQSIITFHASANLYKRLSDGSRLKIKNKILFAPCNYSDFDGSIFGSSTFKNYYLQYAYCPTGISFLNNQGECPTDIPGLDENCTGKPEFNISGVYLSEEFNFIQATVAICDSSNTTLDTPFKVKCLDIKNVTNLFKSNAEVKVNLVYANNVMDPINYALPNKTFLDQIYWTINPKISKNADIFVDAEIIQDSDHFVSPFSNNRTFYSIDPNKVRETQNVLEGESTSFTLLTFQIRRSTFNSVTTRTYIKVQDILGQIGGFTKSLLFFLAFLAIGYAKYKYQMVLSNELYDFEPSEDKNNNKKNKKAKGKKNNKKIDPKATGVDEDLLINENPKASILDNDHLKGSELVNHEVKNYFETEEKKRRGLNYNEYAYIKTLICCRRKSHDEKLADKAMEQVEHDVDLVLILKKLREIDKLKTLLLDRDQRELFNFNPKPIIKKDDERASRDFTIDHPSVGINPKRFFEWDGEYESLSRYGKLYVSYRNIRDNTDPAKVENNRALLEMLGPELLRVFKYVDIEIGDSSSADKFEEVIKRTMEDEDFDDKHQVVSFSKDWGL